MATSAINLGKDVGKDVLEELTVGGASGWLKSFQSQLEKSNIGRVASDLLKSDFTPLWKKNQVNGRKFFEHELGQIPEAMHIEVTNAVKNKSVHPNPAVNRAAQMISKIYHNQQIAKPIELDTARGGTELQKWLDWNQKYTKRVARERVFGSKDEALASIIKGAYKERGLPYANTVADGLSMFFREDRRGFPVGFKQAAMQGKDAVPLSRVDSPYHSVQQWERKLRSMMAWSFTPRIAIPHLSQFMNSTLVNGIKPTAEAMAAIMRDPQASLERIIQSGAMEDEMFFHMEDMINKRNSTKLGKFLLNMKQPGFKQVRKWQIVLSGLGGKYAAQEHASDLVRGVNVKEAETMLKFYGLDTQEVLKAGGLTAEMEDKAMYRAAEEAMFIRSGLHTPPKWDRSSATRMVFMYKHYMFNEGRLLADIVRRDFSISKAKGLHTLAYIGTAFPMAGYGVKMMMNTATGHPPTETPESGKITGVEPVDEWFESMGHVAGFGIGYSIARAARRRALADTLMGPILGTGVDLAQDILAGNTRELVRDVTRKAGVAGPLLTNIGLPSKKKKKESGGYGSY
jgi:hypothetical protein